MITIHLSQEYMQYERQVRTMMDRELRDNPMLTGADYEIIADDITYIDCINEIEGSMLLHRINILVDLSEQTKPIIRPSPAIREAENYNGTAKFVNYNGKDGDARLVLWQFENGHRAIDTNGDPIFEGDEGFDDLLEQIIKS